MKKIYCSCSDFYVLYGSWKRKTGAIICILEESKVQAKIVKNATRYLTGEAQEGAIAFGSTDNRKTYNNTSSVNLTGNNFYVRDEQDIRSLAVEIATLTRRQQRGRGLRMA